MRSKAFFIVQKPINSAQNEGAELRFSPSVCLSAANLRRFHRLILPQAAPISNVPLRGRYCLFTAETLEKSLRLIA